MLAVLLVGRDRHRRLWRDIIVAFIAVYRPTWNHCRLK
jgi:hypothetical protein